MEELPKNPKPELPGKPKTEPEMPTRRGRPEREMPMPPVEPAREEPTIRPNTPETPMPHPVPQSDTPPIMT